VAPRTPTAEAAAHAVFNGGGSPVRFVPRGRRHETAGTHQRGTSWRDSRQEWGRASSRLAVSFRLRQSWPNYSLKRTAPSLRFWCSRLAQALGLWFPQGWCVLPAPCGTSHADRCGRRACRFQRRRITGSVCSSRAQARDVSHASAWHLAARLPARVRQGESAPCRVVRAPAVLA